LPGRRHLFRMGTEPGNIGLGYLHQPSGISDEWILAGTYEIEVEGRRIPADVHLKAPYDPRGERLRL
jgi:glycine cleavage system aminomethyltransferase T